jgi:hypothetical protein
MVMQPLRCQISQWGAPRHPDVVEGANTPEVIEAALNKMTDVIVLRKLRRLILLFLIVREVPGCHGLL